MKRFFQKVDEQLNICYKGQWYFVKKEENQLQYETVLRKLSNETLTDEHFEEALSEVGLYKAQKNKDLRIEKGNIFILDTKAPKIFTEIINNSLSNNVSVDYLIKFFKNILFDTDYKSDTETRRKIKNLFNGNAYCPDKKSQIVFTDKPNDYKELPFYSYAKLNESVKEIFRKETTIEDLCTNYFGENGKGLETFVLNELLDHDNKEVNSKIILYFLIFKNVLHSNNLKEAYEKDYLKNLLDNDFDFSNRVHLLNEIFINFTEKKIMSFLKKGFVLEDIITILEKYPTVSRIHSLNNFKFLNIKEVKDFIVREFNKIQMGDDFILAQESITPCLKELSGKHFKEIGLTCVIPQSYYELIGWSSVMGNCIGSSPTYAKKALKGSSILIGFTKTKNIKDYKAEDIFYNIEISGGRIVQFEAPLVRRSGVTQENLDFITKLFQKEGLIKK